MNQTAFTTTAILALSILPAATHADTPFRPPAVPLVAGDPYFSIWSMADHLTDDVTRHWTNHAHSLVSLVRIDGQTYRIMGVDPANVPALPQTSVTVLPTRSIYTFAGAGIDLTVTFLTPKLPDDMGLLARPVTYLTWTAHATDGKAHDAALYFDAAPDIAVNDPSEPVVWSKPSIPGLAALRVGTLNQPVLATAGDDVRIDWGYFYAAAPDSESPTTVTSDPALARSSFVGTGALPATSETDSPKAPNAGAPSLAFDIPFGKIGAEPKSRYIMLAYDEEYSIEYFWTSLRPYWRRNGATVANMLQMAAEQYPSLQTRCADFDAALNADLLKVGGPQYMRMCDLGYRQTFAATGFAADRNGQPLAFPKENTSNGDMSTVDVVFPMSPQFLLFGPTLTKALLIPDMDYGASAKWKQPFAPHDIGTYPRANGPSYGFMPVEESGNLIILVDALARMEGSSEFADKYWPALTRWAEYLRDNGLDPEHQLSTDDFAGPLAHQVGLSSKAIVALGAYAQLCDMRGDTTTGDKYRALAKNDVTRWMAMADDGDHYRLAFDKPGTWGQKYNLVWDKVLGTDLFPQSVFDKETAYYAKVSTQYGFPLDSRKAWTNVDHSTWSAALSSTNAGFESLIAPEYNFLDTSPSHVPLADFYWSDSGREAGMHARSVVGGLYIKMLLDPAIWRKWASSDTTKAANWAKQPDIIATNVVPISDPVPQTWQYTLTQPSVDWYSPTFDASSWTAAGGGFGNDTWFPSRTETMWATPDIWMRRSVDMPTVDTSTLQLWDLVSGDADIYVNGVLAASMSGVKMYAFAPTSISPAALATIKPGQNLIAVHCRRRDDTQFIDVGLATLTDKS